MSGKIFVMIKSTINRHKLYMIDHDTGVAELLFLNRQDFNAQMEFQFMKLSLASSHCFHFVGFFFQ